MKTILQMFRLGSTTTFRLRSMRTLISHLFPAPEVKQEKRMLKAGDTLYKGIVRRLRKKKPGSPYNRKLLLHRRLKQYQQVRRHGSTAAKVQAIHRLKKEWRKFQRDCRRSRQ